MDAGYRWAWAELEEPGIVRRGEPVDVEDVGLIPPDDPENPACREIRVQAPRPAARPPKT